MKIRCHRALKSYRLKISLKTKFYSITNSTEFHLILRSSQSLMITCYKMTKTMCNVGLKRKIFCLVPKNSLQSMAFNRFWKRWALNNWIIHKWSYSKLLLPGTLYTAHFSQLHVYSILNIVRTIARARIHTRTEQLMRSLDRTHKLVFRSVITPMIVS